MEKEKVTRSRAKASVREATEAFLRPLMERGLLQVGSTTSDGEPITEEYVAEIRQMIDEAGWNILRDMYEIVED